MEYLVNGKKFSNIEEARQYEDAFRKSNIESSSDNSKDSLSRIYKQYIRSKLHVFKVMGEQAKPKYIAIVADREHIKYLHALLGSPYKLENSELVKCWDCTKLTGRDIINNIVDSFVYEGNIVPVTSKAHFECCVDACEKRGENPYYIFVARGIKAKEDIAKDYIKTGEKFIELTNKSITSAEELFDIFYRLGL